MGIKSDRWIREQAQKSGMIEPFEAGQVRENEQGRIVSYNSSNSNRLQEIAIKLGKPAYLIDGAEDIQREWIPSSATIGVTAGASAPEVLVHEVLGQLKDWGAKTVQEQSGIEENIVFRVPKELQKKT